MIRSPFTSAALSRLSLSVDWYDIKITGAIEPLTGEVLYQQCLNADGKSNPTYTIDGNPLCAYINREVGDGGNRNEIAPFFNFGSIKTSGVDVQLDWASELADLPLTHALPGAINLNVVVNWLAHYDVQTTPGGAVTDYAGTVNGGGGSQFRYRTYTTLTYSEGPASLGMRWRHLPSAKDGSYALDPTTLTKGVGQHDEFDLFGHWALNKTYDLRAGIDNLFDAEPEVEGANPANDALGITLPDYDVLGRRFYVGIKARF